MGVLDGQAVSAAVTNPAFINKNVDDSMPNKLGLSRALSGATIADIQATANKLYAATGASESQTGTVYNATASTITNGDPYQTALTKVANKFDPATGHMHTGAAGDGPVLDVVLDIAASGYSPVDGHITFTPGPNMTITESGGDFTFTSAGGIAVDSLAVSGNTPLTGNVTFTAGANMTITQSGQNFDFAAASGGGGGGGAIVDDWIAYTPSLFQGFGTTTNVDFFYRRVADSIEIRGYFTGGTMTSSEARISLPAGLTSADNTKLPALSLGGYITADELGARSYTILIQQSVTYMNIGLQSAGSGGITIQNANSIFSDGDTISLVASFPIQQWNGGGGGIGGGSLIAFYGNNHSGTITGSSSNITWASQKDTNSAWSTDTYTVPLSDYYYISIKAVINGNYIGAKFSAIYILQNGSSILNVFGGDSAGLGAADFSEACVHYLTAGDLITSQVQSTAVTPTFSGTPENSNFSIASLSIGGGGGFFPSQVTVNTQGGYGSTGTAVVYYAAIESTVGTDITYTSDVVNGDTFTINTTGGYAVFVNSRTTPSASDFGISLNASSTTTSIASLSYTEIFAVQYVNGNLEQVFSRTAYLQAGDILRVQSDSAPLDVSNPAYRCSIVRVF